MNSPALNSQQLAAYCQRIGLEQPIRADLATLEALHCAHIATIPFENIDVQLGMQPPREIEGVFEKLVHLRRGGWCYEMNLLFHAAITSLGFNARRVACSVSRNGECPEHCGDHLALIVAIDGVDYLADVGFGGSLRIPLPLEKLKTRDGPYEIVIDQTSQDRWRYDESATGDALFGYEFEAGPADEQQIAAMQLAQATEDWSPFVKNLVAQRREKNTHFALRGKVFTQTGLDGVQKTTLESEDAFAKALYSFGLELDTGHLWQKVEERHRVLFGDEN